MEVLKLSIEDTFARVEFYPDDTLERVRELIAIDRSSHPDRLFIQILVTLPKGYYSTPKEWTDLFFRLSRDGSTVTKDVLEVYLDQIRVQRPAFEARDYSREEWEAVSSESAIREGGPEWHILGAKQQTVLPLPIKDVILPTNAIPLLSLQMLFETLHPYANGDSVLRVTELPDDPSDAVLRVYFPRMTPETPPNLGPSKDAILKSQADLGKLLSLEKVPKHATETITRAKWYIPLNATRFPTPRTTFEQFFYGLTVSKDTPYIAYFTAEGNALRSKFYVEDPTAKPETFLEKKALKSWYASTTPNRTRPTLLLYRKGPVKGTHNIFQRIAITSSDITLDIRKDKTSTATLDEMRKEAEEWLLSLDAIAPSLDARDLTPDRWELADLSLVASYAKEETDFDMLRFDCLQSIFGREEGKFRLLRAEQGDIPRRVVDACQALTREDATPTASYLAGALGTSTEEAASLLETITTGELNCDRALRDFPVMAFHRKDVEIQFATKEYARVLAYADILRYVLTAGTEEVNAVCPRRKESVGPASVVPQAMVPLEDEDEEGEDITDFLGLAEEPAANAAPAPEPLKPSRTLKVAEDIKTTQNYFNERLKAFDPKLFAAPYSRECEKSNQVIVLTPEAKEIIRKEKGEQYTYEDAAEEEQMDIPGGTAICPPYWCMRDLIPLREDQLVKDDDGTLHCPVCNGKVRPNDKVSTKEFTVIKRETSKGKTSLYPRSMAKREGVPCCYPTPAKERVLVNRHAEVTYVLTEELRDIPPKRVARLPPELAARLGVRTSYESTITNGRLEYGKEDIFRIGLGGRPRETLPSLLKSVPIPSPKERPDIVKQCSFYSTIRSLDPVEDVERRWQDKTLDPLDEIEYLSFFLNYGVILVSMDRMKVLCGFRTPEVFARKQTIVVLLRKDGHPELLGTMRRKKKGLGGETLYKVDAVQPPFDTMLAGVQQAHALACSGDLPTFTDAASAMKLELKLTGAEGLVDPLGRIQALFVKGKAILPFSPSTSVIQTTETPDTLKELYQLRDEDLPTYADEVAALNAVKKEGFHHEPSKDRRNAAGLIVEVETVAGFRAPVRPSAPPSPGPVSEVLETVRGATGVDTTGKELKGEQVLVSGEPDPGMRTLKDTIDYASEVYEFLLFSLAGDIAADANDYADLRSAIERKDAAALGPLLADWYKKEAYEDASETPYRFLSKVRTPCGQMKDESTCKASSLCGWDKGDCKVRVQPSRSTGALLPRIQTTLLKNDKQRALVLDNRLSRFFSTVLYLEMPNEWITTSYS